MKLPFIAICSISVLILAGCADSNKSVTESTTETSTKAVPALNWVEAKQTYNREAPIPSQCYTKTDQHYNPCYVCHQTYKNDPDRPNAVKDGFLQGVYAFSDEGVTNSWTNLFVDRRAYIDSVSDTEILKYIDHDNYSPLIETLKNSDWKGAIPEVKNLHLGKEAFDSKGIAKDGSHWIAFNYKPVPSTFWPTNGSTDDVMIRLPKAFREINGEYNEAVYFANLAMVEMTIQGLDSTPIYPLDESLLNKDLDGNSQINTAQTLVKSSHYLGDAKSIEVDYMLYPEGTEFLHTVRYIGVNGDEIYNAKRMKEVRYMEKRRFLSKEKIASVAYLETKEKHFEQVPRQTYLYDEGTSNKNGWLMIGFIEDENGDLRRQHKEEEFFCAGCHKSIGSTIDFAFAFSRKIPGTQGWGYIDLSAITDAPNLGESKGEFQTYMSRVGGGDEFRQNQEMLEKWFKEDGSLDEEKVEGLSSIYELIKPSRDRALALNKAYQAIVKEQSYLYGRDTVIAPATNVYKTIDESTQPLLQEHRYQWDIRLDWNNH